MGARHRASDTAQGHVKGSSAKKVKGAGCDSDDAVQLTIRPELAKELHQLLTAALGGARRKKAGVNAEAETGKHRKGG